MLAVPHSVAGRVEELPGVLPHPCPIKVAGAVPVHKARQAGTLVNMEQPPFHIGLHPTGELSAQLQRLVWERREEFPHPLRNHGLGPLRPVHGRRARRRTDTRDRRGRRHDLH